MDRRLTWRDGDRSRSPTDGAAPEAGVCQEGLGSRDGAGVAEPYRPQPGESVRLRAVVRGQAQLASIFWHLGDGAVASGPEVEHSFAEAYDYPVRVLVTTDTGERLWGTECLIVEEPLGATTPLMHSTFGPEDEDWWFRWQCYRPAPPPRSLTVLPVAFAARLRASGRGHAGGMDPSTRMGP